MASSRRQLQRAYAEIGRTTFRDHLTRVRMQKAADMLSTRALTVREVAHRVDNSLVIKPHQVINDHFRAGLLLAIRGFVFVGLQSSFNIDPAALHQVFSGNVA